MSSSKSAKRPRFVQGRVPHRECLAAGCDQPHKEEVARKILSLCDGKDRSVKIGSGTASGACDAKRGVHRPPVSRVLLLEQCRGRSTNSSTKINAGWEPSNYFAGLTERLVRSVRLRQRDRSRTAHILSG